MAIKVLGAYPTDEEAIKAVDVHTLGGLHAGNITIFTNEEHARSLENQISVTIKTNQPVDEAEKEPTGIMDKFKNMFSNDDDFELYSQELLEDFGLTATEAEKCLTDAANGKVVVLAVDEVRMGHDDIALD